MSFMLDQNICRLDMCYEEKKKILYETHEWQNKKSKKFNWISRKQTSQIITSLENEYFIMCWKQTCWNFSLKGDVMFILCSKLRAHWRFLKKTKTKTKKTTQQTPCPELYQLNQNFWEWVTSRTCFSKKCLWWVCCAAGIENHWA